MVATIERKRTKKTADKAEAGPAGDLIDVAVGRLLRHPDNRYPTEESIVALMASLQAEGQIEPIVVRPLEAKADGWVWQIVSGETRMIAAHRLGWKTLAAKVVSLDDAAALRVLAAANAARQDLNPIDQAKLIQRLCQPVEEGGSGLTREAAAKMFDLQSGGAASNLVRLLELPQVWQHRVAAGELPQSYARELLPLVVLGDESEAWDQLDHEFGQREDDYSDFQNREDVKRLVVSAIETCTRPIEKGDDQFFREATKGGPNYLGTHPLRFKLTPSLEEELRIIEIEIEGVKRRRATNCQLYDSFQIPAIKAYQAKKNGKATAEADAEDDKPARALTPKQQAAEDARRKEEAAEKLAKRIERWRAAWLRELVARKIETDKVGDVVCRVACNVSMWLVARSPDINYRERAALDLDEFLPWRGVLDHRKMPTAFELVCRVLRLPGKDGYEHPFPDDKVEDLVELLKIDLVDAWLVMQSGRGADERMVAFLKLHTADQLDALGSELGVGTIGAAKKAGKIGLLLDAPKTLKLPRSLRGRK